MGGFHSNLSILAGLILWVFAKYGITVEESLLHQYKLPYRDDHFIQRKY